MAILNILQVPDKRLYKKSSDVLNIDNKIRKLLNDMLETMYHSNGIGLAAPQIGINKNIIVVDIQEDGIKMPYFIINPKIIFKSKETIAIEEGCLSVPDQKILIDRNAVIKLKYLDHNGNENLLKADGLFSICIQHEMDHLKGITILERDQEN